MRFRMLPNALATLVKPELNSVKAQEITWMTKRTKRKVDLRGLLAARISRQPIKSSIKPAKIIVEPKMILTISSVASAGMDFMMSAIPISANVNWD